MSLNILFEDNYIIVVEKPAGIATQSAKVGEPDLETELRKYRKTKGESPEIYVVHRLDQPVSGILVFAKTKEAAAGLTKAMQKDSFSKDYKAVIYKGENIIPIEKIELVDFLVKDSKTNSSRVTTNSKEPGAKEARLIYRKESEDEKTATLNVHLLTGRHHQIRLQLSNAGMPIVGDLKYGSSESINYSKEEKVRFVKLKAYHLSFKHPITGKGMDFEVSDK